MKFLLLGLGLALALEGGLYFLFADQIKGWLTELLKLPTNYLRWGGLFVLIAGMLLTLWGYSLFEP